MMTDTQINSGAILNGAEEYFSYKGVVEGYEDSGIRYGNYTDMPFPNTGLSFDCVNAYLAGYALGLELRRLYVNQETNERDSLRSRGLTNAVSM